MNVPYVDVTVRLAREQITSMLICGFEGGSNYWYDELEPIKRLPLLKDEIPSDRFYRSLLQTGFKLFDKETRKHHTVTPDDIREACYLLGSTGWIKNLADVLREEDDAETGDHFIQLCVFKEVIYG